MGICGLARATARSSRQVTHFVGNARGGLGLHRTSRMCWILVAVCVAPSVLSAQFIQGTVRDASTTRTLDGAFAAVIDTSGAIVSAMSADHRGKYAIRLSAPGTYAVVATYPGYRREVSRWLSMTPSDSLEVGSNLAPVVTRLTPVVIRAERDSLLALRNLGLSPRALGGTIRTPLQVREAADKSSTVYDVLQALRVPGLTIKYRFEQNTWRNCVIWVRTGGCVLTVIDGAPHPNDAYGLDMLLAPALISYVFYLRPDEAATFFGTQSTNGVLFIVTKGATR